MMSSSREIILTSSPEGPIIAYDVGTGASLAHFAGSRSPRKGLTLAGKTLIAASHVSSDAACGSIHLYNWWSSTAFHQVPVPEPVAPITATLDGMFLFSGGLSGRIHVLSLPSGRKLRSFPAHSKPVSCLTLNDDGSLLVSGGDEGSIAVFPVLSLLDVSIDDNDDSTNLMLYSFVAHDSGVTSITIGMGICNATMISCSLDCTCKFWSLAHGTHLRTLRFPCMIWGVAVDTTESEFYAGGSDGRVYAGALKVNSRRRQLVSRSVVGRDELVIWGIEDGGAVTSVALTNEGTNLVSASEDGRIRVWEVERGEMIRIIGHERFGISDLVVAKGIRGGGGVGGGGTECSSGGLGFCGRELRKPMRESTEMEEVLNEVVKDRSRAIDTLESAIGTYQRLLELILKEAKAGTNSDNRKRGKRKEMERLKEFSM